MVNADQKVGDGQKVDCWLDTVNVRDKAEG